MFDSGYFGKVITEMMLRVNQIEFEPRFSDNSYGFRPNRSAHDAIRKVIAKANDGYEYVIDLDLAKFFDTVNHSK